MDEKEPSGLPGELMSFEVLKANKESIDPFLHRLSITLALMYLDMFQSTDFLSGPIVSEEETSTVKSHEISKTSLVGSLDSAIAVLQSYNPEAAAVMVQKAEVIKGTAVYTLEKLRPALASWKALIDRTEEISNQIEGFFQPNALVQYCHERITHLNFQRATLLELPPSDRRAQTQLNTTELMLKGFNQAVQRARQRQIK